MSDYRDQLVDALHAASQDYDRAVLTIASGTLAISVTFAHDIATKPVPNSAMVLVASWVLLVAALVMIFISLWTSQLTIRKAIADFDSEDEEALKKPGGLAGALTQWLNAVAGICLVLGLLCFAWFARVNI